MLESHDNGGAFGCVTLQRVIESAQIEIEIADRDSGLVLVSVH